MNKDTNNTNNSNNLNPDFDFSAITPEDIQEEIGSLKKENHLTGEDLLNRKIAEIHYLVNGLFQRSGIACLAGPSDVGKSMLLRQFVISIVTKQKTFLGLDIKPRHHRGIYVSSEDAENETSFLLLKQTRGYNPEDLRGLRFLFDTENLLSKLDTMLTDAPADVVVIDCFADAFGADLKDTQKIRTFLHPFQTLASKHDTLIIFLHHTGKRTENFEPSKNNLLAGQGFEAKMRLVIELRGDSTIPTHRHMCIVKGNYLPAFMKKESFVLDFQEDCFLFNNTGDRMPFELLVKQPNEDTGKQRYEQAKELKAQGLSYEQIAYRLNYSSKGTISKLFDKAKKQGWENESVSNSVSNGNDGNENGNGVR